MDSSNTKTRADGWFGGRTADSQRPSRRAAAVIGVCAALVGGGAGVAYADHGHTSNYWLHGLEYGGTNSFVHAHMHSSDGTTRGSYVAYGACGRFHSDPEQYHFGVNNGIDIATGSLGEDQFFASTRSPQTGLSHHHHAHYCNG